MNRLVEIEARLGKLDASAIESAELDLRDLLNFVKTMKDVQVVLRGLVALTEALEQITPPEKLESMVMLKDLQSGFVDSIDEALDASNLK